MQNQNRAGLGIATALDAHNYGITHFFLGAQRGLQVFGIDVHPGGRDDDFFLASLEKQIAVCVERAEVAGAVPAFVASDGHEFTAIPVAAGDAAAANQNFAIVGEPQLRDQARLCRSNRGWCGKDD